MKTSTMKRILSLVLALCMLMSIAGCAKAPQTGDGSAAASQNTQVTLNTAPAGEDQAQTGEQQDEPQASREELEQIAGLLGDEKAAANLNDEQLAGYVEGLIQDLDNKQNTAGIENLGNTQQSNSESVAVDPENYDSNGAMTVPFDQAYPELVDNGTVEYDDETLLLKLDNGTGLTAGMKAAGVASLEAVVPLKSQTWYEAKLVAGTDAQVALAAVRELSEVKLAEFNYTLQTDAIDEYVDCDNKHGHDNNEHHKDQWHMHHCGITQGYDDMKTDGGDSSVIVAVIDTGVDYDHEDLAGNIWVNNGEVPDNNIDDDNNGYIDDYYGVDIVSGYGNGDDTNGHGTHVAGIIAAQNNNLGVVGIAYNVTIMPVKAASHAGIFLQADIAKAIYYAAENGAEVINMSFGGTACSIAVQDALADAYTNTVLVASAGNNGAPNEGLVSLPNYPAALTYVLGVMSVDQYGVESYFTNYDVTAFNGVEYELYAPGNSIMSTLPDDQYGKLSGTSMAAPVVSAMAAILRSEFTDRSMYPTKFIYGQLASTSGYNATCCGGHGVHNLPQIVDLHAALTELPQPELSVQDYALFDDPKYSDKNNGDGVIDAGETIALGLTLRNRWGMSKETLVTVDTISESSGMADPYFEILNPTVDYDCVGTYSTQDCGKVWTDELHTGWEDPFLIKVSDDCPNDYIFNLNITIQCKNALDEQDTTVYSFDASMQEAVRSGYILPAVIEEDMVLTPDNLYIISNGTLIKEGVTVRVEPGTHIQFWTDDPNDTYADTYIAYLMVNGNFLVEGTKEDPVYIYPSGLMDSYNVEISEGYTTGYISMKYADITNLGYISNSNTGSGNKISLADHCTFRMNYTWLRQRYVSSGKVYTRSSPRGEMCIGDINARDCVFYKLAGIEVQNNNIYTGKVLYSGTADRCVFTECAIVHQGVYSDCVFLGNSMASQMYPDEFVNSSSGFHFTNSLGNIDSVSYRAEIGTTYFSADSTAGSRMHEYLESIGAQYLVLETEEELTWLNENFEYGQSYKLKTVYNEETGTHVWPDGSPIETLPDPDGKLAAMTREDELDISLSPYNGSSINVNNSNAHYYLYELPGQILPEAITFDRYEVTMDLDTTYQLTPLSAPVQHPADGFLYESTDESVVTVSETGLVTPVSLGTADIWVYSMDKAVKNYVTVTVKDYVALESFCFTQTSAEVAIGQTLRLPVAVTPANTTRQNVTYSCSNPAVATIDGAGNITGISSGTATVTATCEDFTSTADITVYNSATSLELSAIALTAGLSQEAVDLPEITLSQGAEATLTWRSTDEAVATVENGKVILKALGTTSLVVTDSRSGLSAACLLIVTEEPAARIKDAAFEGYTHLVLLENGDLYLWSNQYNTTPTCIATSVKLFDMSYPYCLILFENGTLKTSSNLNSSSISLCDVTGIESDWNIVEIEYCDNGNYYIRLDNGSCYAWGSNNSAGQLGVGTTGTVAEPTLINLDGVVDIVYGPTYSSSSFFLTDNGALYSAGSVTGSSTPTLIASDAVQLLKAGQYYLYYLNVDGKITKLPIDGVSSGWIYPVDLSQMDDIAFFHEGYEGIAIKDGKVYITNESSHNTLTELAGISDASKVFTYNGTYYIATESGLLYGLGQNASGYNHMAGVTTEAEVNTPVMIPLASFAEESAAVTGNNLIDNVLSDDTLTLEFNKSVASVNPKLYADGTQVTVLNEIKNFNQLHIYRSSGFTSGVSYELVFDAGTVHCASGVTNTEELRISFTYTPSDADDEAVEAPVVHESILDETVERYLTTDRFNEMLTEYQQTNQINPYFYSNAILNPISTDTNVEHWLRILAPSSSAGSYAEYALGGNYWGSANKTAIELQMIDYTDFGTYARLMYEPYLTEAPENTFPFVTDVAIFNAAGERVTTVGNEKITVRISFNRDMDTTIPLKVRFGSAYPYGDYEIEGSYIGARTWQGEYTLNTLIENGNQLWTISEGCSATEDLALQLDRGRFGFVIDTTAAQALIMQGNPTATGIELKWTQDDFETLMGYNVYRSEAEDGLYTKLNTTVIPADTMTWFDDTVEPGVQYFYNFTVVQTDLTESIPSGKIAIMSMDTMAPNIYHSPVASAFTGSNLVISATVTDNLNIAHVRVYYRTVGDTQWKTVQMNKLNDKYSAIIPAADISTAGLEYYLEAYDGISYTCKGSADAPYAVTVREAIDKNALGDVNGDGAITNLDALILLQAINDLYNMTDEEFARADIDGNGELAAKEALRILHYVSGKIGSVAF